MTKGQSVLRQRHVGNAEWNFPLSSIVKEVRLCNKQTVHIQTCLLLLGRQPAQMSYTNALSMHDVPFSPDTLLTTQQVAERRNVDKGTVAKWCHDGLLPNARKVGRDWLIPARALDEFEPPPAGNPRWRQRAAQSSTTAPKRQIEPSVEQQAVLRALAEHGAIQWDSTQGFQLTTAHATRHVRTTTVQALVRRGYIDAHHYTLTPMGTSWVQLHPAT